MKIHIISLLGLVLLVQVLNSQANSDVLSEKVEQLTEWSLKKPVIRLNFDKFKNFVKSAPRNYSIVVMLTALASHRECQICRPANDEFQIVAQSWRYSPQFSNKLFFAMVDFDDAPDVFKMLNTASAPQFILFTRKQGKPKAADHFDISRVGFSAEQISKWINDRTEINIRVFRPPNYSGLLLIVLLVLMIGSLLYVKRNNLEFLYNRTTWSMIVISFILIFISGQMWNQIRGPPMVYRNPQTGQVVYMSDDNDFQLVAETLIVFFIYGFFAGGHGYQFIAETYIVFAIYGAIVAGMIFLNEAPKYVNEGNVKKPNKNDTWPTSTVLAVGGIVMVTFFFSMILSIFRSKYQGYPYSLFL